MMRSRSVVDDSSKDSMTESILSDHHDNGDDSADDDADWEVISSEEDAPTALEDELTAVASPAFKRRLTKAPTGFMNVSQAMINGIINFCYI